jgi:hypothetical protein
MVDETRIVAVNEDKKDDNNNKVEKLTAGLYFTFITTIGLLSGFGISLVQSKKQDTRHFNKGLLQQKQADIIHESGVSFARRALARATIYSVGGFSLFCFSIWKLSGANNFVEFRQKIGSVLPQIKKTPREQEGRTEFENLTELFQYVIDEDKRQKDLKETQQNVKD